MFSLPPIHRFWRTGVWLACLVCASGCEAPEPQSEAVRPAAQTSALLPSDDVELLSAVDNPAEGLPNELFGRLEPVPPNSDANRVLVLEAGVPAVGIEPGTRVLDAQHVEDGIIVVGVDHVLRHFTAAGVRELDQHVHAPVSVAAGKVAYVMGGVPDLTLKQVELAEGTPSELAPGISPVWAPVLSADGAEVLFVATVDGRPHLLHRAKDGVIYEVSWSGRTPSAPVTPRWSGRYLIFGDEAGVAVLDIEQGTMVSEHPSAKLLPDLREGAVQIEVAGMVERIEVERIAIEEVGQ